MKLRVEIGRVGKSITPQMIVTKQCQGFALVSALLLVVVVGIVAVTVLQTTSTEIKISGNQRQAVQDFYAAEAGLAEAKARLRNRPGTEQFFIADLGQNANPIWSAYIVTSTSWTPNDDQSFSSQLLNYFPQPGNPTSSAIQPNSMQSLLPYWIKVRHKTEYDAEQTGHKAETPHYLDLDGTNKKHQVANVGNVIFYGYSNKDSIIPQPLTIQGPTPWLPVKMVTVHGGNGASGVLLEAELFHPPGPNHLGAVYAAGAVTFAGQGGAIYGHDACGGAPSLPPVYSGSLVTSGEAMQFDGGPTTPYQGGVELDLSQALTGLKSGAISVQSGLSNQESGSSPDSATYFIQGTNQSPTVIRNFQGRGMLLVNGSAILEGEVSWEGMIIVNGELIIQGDGAAITLQGGLWVSALKQMGGQLSVQYNSCFIKSALLSQPVKVRTWKEVSSGF
ncbi:pilus assembly PilX family protein [Candidatus Nitronereus thalassa]|uniref:PilX N-terminal domain-containing pilus assembly protein n=1 Tax=Candidatus Nitronereus thalassa TaxID=3020898 RepID=A0ABU3K6K9_9BACT|nr:PilX N-terminal domain-containing pilus assembly protein [Candidatus Nitronereus thalassa]MDT7042017.1 PilX N-terminal domain-containing pilus assembly protein [Candidatus Nitronereus thalassa]